MARMLGPDPNTRTAWRIVAGVFRTAAGAVAVVYSNSVGTVLADIEYWDGSSTPAGAVPDSALVVDYKSEYPRFWFPDGVDVVYASVDNGPLVEVHADYDSRFDTVEARIVDLEAGGDADALLVHRAGTETITGAKTFGTSPVVPTPTSSTHASTKAYVDSIQGALQPLDSDLTAIAALAASNDDVLQRKAGAWTNRTPAQVKADLPLTKSDVGLGAVDNTADTAKPVSTAQAAADTAVADTAAAALAAHAADSTNVHGVADMGNLVLTDDARLADARTPTVHATSHEFGGLDEIEVAQGQVAGLAAALAAKAPLASPALTGTPTAPTAAADTATTQVATTAFAVGEADAAQAQAVQRANHTGTQSADTLTDGTTNKAFLDTERVKLAGIATGATANATDAQLRDRATHTGTQSADTLTDGSTNVAMLATERTKLAGVATGATANATDAQLRDRSTHTGTQAAGTITGLSAAATAAFGSTAGTVAEGDKPVMKATATTKGDLFVATASATVARLAAGANNSVLVADSAQTEGVKYTSSPIVGGLTVAGNTVYAQPLVPADQGYISWTYPGFAQIGSTAIPTAGRLELVRVHRVPAGTITNIVIFIQTAGVSLTSGQCFAALYSAAGTLLSQTADQATAWGSSGLKTMALAAPQVVAAGDLYVGFWFNGTTGPTVIRQSGTLATSLYNGGTAAPNLMYAHANTGLTTTAPGPFGTQTANNLSWWVALS